MSKIAFEAARKWFEAVILASYRLLMKTLDWLIMSISLRSTLFANSAISSLLPKELIKCLKRADEKTESAKFQKLFYVSYIILRIQVLEDKQCRFQIKLFSFFGILSVNPY